MREIIFDTETTGFDPFTGDRLIEIGCVEMVNHVVTGPKGHFHRYVNPERDVPESAVKIHGLTMEFLADKPLFSEVVEEFLAYLGEDSVLVAHNAEFDKKFINHELEQAGFAPLPPERFKDTLAIARTKFPGQQNSLDALCRRFGVENGHRTLHGALLDSEILAEVYIELLGGKQAGLDLSVSSGSGPVGTSRKIRPHRRFPVCEAELEAHAAFVDDLTNPLWRTD
ncbi:DNA polymerase III subunit epsilon [Yunchengibacter salinarum]|uniref:DNA polymerase III subunit epsilon n=1 Tax=Yunchengibacter salinarum TaxID=3133399 RepID=UPI0035B5ADD5